MAVDIGASSASELLLSERIRQAALTQIQERNLSHEQLAKILGIPETGVYLLSLKESWPLHVSVRVAEALGLEVELTIGQNGGGVAAEDRAA